MLINSNILHPKAIALGLILATIYGLPLTAQTSTPEDFLDDIQAEENTSWNFTSEEETFSIQNNLKELGEYNISDSDPDPDVELERENRRWNNNIGGREKYTIETDVYDY